jgi:hypothetical protein
MGDSSRHQRPKTQAASAGGPPRPPKKIARGLEDNSPDDHKKLIAEARAKLTQLIEKYGKK